MPGIRRAENFSPQNLNAPRENRPSEHPYYIYRVRVALAGLTRRDKMKYDCMMKSDPEVRARRLAFISAYQRLTLRSVFCVFAFSRGQICSFCAAEPIRTDPNPNNLFSAPGQLGKEAVNPCSPAKNMRVRRSSPAPRLSDFMGVDGS